ADVLGLEPHQIAMVAAHNSDLAAAQALGLRTVFVRRPTEHGPDQTTDLAADGEWDVVAEDFEDLADRIGWAFRLSARRATATSRDEEAEWVTVVVLEHVEEFVLVIAAVHYQFGTQVLCPAALPVELVRVRHGEVEMQ